jgi:hypothetical protein
VRKHCIAVDELCEIRTTHGPAPLARGALAEADNKLRASVRATPMKDDTSAIPPRLQKEPNLSHMGFHRACKLPFFPR